MKKENIVLGLDQYLLWKKWKPDQKKLRKITLESSCSKILQNSIGNTRGGFVF